MAGRLFFRPPCHRLFSICLTIRHLCPGTWQALRHALWRPSPQALGEPLASTHITHRHASWRRTDLPAGPFLWLLWGCPLRRLEPGSGIVSQVVHLCRMGSRRTSYIPEWEDARMRDAGCRVQGAGCRMRKYGINALRVPGFRTGGTNEKVAG